MPQIQRRRAESAKVSVNGAAMRAQSISAAGVHPHKGRPFLVDGRRYFWALPSSSYLCLPHRSSISTFPRRLKADILQAEPGQLILRPRPVRHLISSYAFHPLAPKFNVGGGGWQRTCKINSVRASPLDAQVTKQTQH